MNDLGVASDLRVLDVMPQTRSVFQSVWIVSLLAVVGCGVSEGPSDIGKSAGGAGSGNGAPSGNANGNTPAGATAQNPATQGDPSKPTPTNPNGVTDPNPTPPAPDPSLAKKSWKAMSEVGAPADAECPSAVWTGSKMIVVGGSSARTLVTAYDPATDTWQSLESKNSPPGRIEASSVWTGSKLIQWGGRQYINGCSPFCWYYEGYVYDPATSTWTQTTNAPIVEGLYFARFGHAAVWAGNRMIASGGSTPYATYDTTQAYDPATNAWSNLPKAPEKRSMVSATLMGDVALFFGGSDTPTPESSSMGFAKALTFDTKTNTWGTSSMKEPPLSLRAGTALAWTGDEVAVWGGYLGADTFGDGAAYNPKTDAWSMLPTTGAPSARRCAASVWTGKELIVWGGMNGSTQQRTGAVLR